VQNGQLRSTCNFWIYFRTEECYSMIPRMHLFPVVLVMLWAYGNYYEPLLLPIGLAVLILYAHLDIFLRVD
jgi:hypothetical protein